MSITPERTYKMKLLSAELTAEMRKARDRSTFGPTEEWRNMHAAAPNDATERLIAVLKEARMAVHYEHYRLLRADIEALLKELCDD